MEQLNVGIIGAGWCGGIRTETCHNSALVKDLHVAEIKEDRLQEIKNLVQLKTATTDYKQLINDDTIQVVVISATPETTHYPMALEALQAGKHVFLEKPMALTLEEADDLIRVAEEKGVKFTIGYSQRFNPKFAFAKKNLLDKTIGDPVCITVSRHITRTLGNKIGGRIKLSPAAMESTHDLDFALWCLEPAKPIRVYSQSAYGAMESVTGLEDAQWIMVTMDNGSVITVGGGWTMPPGYPNFSGTWIEVTGTNGMLTVDDTHRDVILNTMEHGIQLPMSTMPGEQVNHVFAGPMHNETLHFLEAVLFDREVMVKPRHARQVMEIYTAADLSKESNVPIELPIKKEHILKSAVA
jgi:predicted dehydrogenase